MSDCRKYPPQNDCYTQTHRMSQDKMINDIYAVSVSNWTIDMSCGFIYRILRASITQKKFVTFMLIIILCKENDRYLWRTFFVFFLSKYRLPSKSWQKTLKILFFLGQNHAFNVSVSSISHSVILFFCRSALKFIGKFRY